MQKIVLRFGLLAGAIVAILMIGGFSLMTNPDGSINFEHGETFGYVSMLVALSLIYFGIRNYRDSQLGGKISFGTAFKVGLFITLVASFIYVVTWMIYYHTSSIADAFGEQYSAYMAENLRKKGTSEADIAKQMAEYKGFMEVYDSNPIVMFGMTLLEIFPVGLFITLLSSFILKSKSIKA